MRTTYKLFKNNNLIEKIYTFKLKYDGLKFI